MSINRKTRNIALTPEQDEFVESLVTSGQYQSASEVVRAALRLLNHDVALQQAELDEIRTRLAESLNAESKGEYVEGTPAEVISAVFEEAKN